MMLSTTETIDPKTDNAPNHPNTIWSRFRAFVKEQPRDELYDPDDTQNCPIAQFAKAKFGKKRFGQARWSYFLTKDSMRVYIVDGIQNRHDSNMRF